MRLTEAQLAALRSVGATLDAKDMEIADKLGRKGFGGDDFVAAYRESVAMKTKYPELAVFGRAIVETIAVAQKLGLNEACEYWFVWDRHQRDQTLTQAYKESVPSGHDLLAFGGVATGVGIVLLVVGMAASTDVTYENGSGNVTSGWGHAGRAMEITGGVGIAAGLSIAVLGLYRWTTPLTDDTRASHALNKNQSLRPSASAQRQSAMRWALSPSLGPHHTGLGLTAAF
jgi:hypothetical protein